MFISGINSIIYLLYVNRVFIDIDFFLWFLSMCIFCFVLGDCFFIGNVFGVVLLRYGLVFIKWYFDMVLVSFEIYIFLWMMRGKIEININIVC